MRVLCLTLLSALLATPVAAQTRSIAVFTPYMPAQPDATTKSAKGGAAMVFGPAGAAGLKVLRNRRSDNFGDIMSAQGFSGPAVFVNDLVQDLTTEGYQVTLVPVARPDAAFVPEEAGAPDYAYLDVVVTKYGYHQGPVGNFQQSMSLTYRANSIVGGRGPVTGKYEATASPQYQFAAMRDFKFNPQLAVAGLNDELAQAAAAVAQAVK